MKKILIALAMTLALVSFAACGGGGDSGGGSSPTADQLVGTWVMSSNNGQACTGCVVLELKAGNAFTVTDNQGIVLMSAGKKSGVYSYDGSMIHLRAGGFEYDATVSNYTGNSVVIGFATYVLQ